MSTAWRRKGMHVHMQQGLMLAGVLSRLHPLLSRPRARVYSEPTAGACTVHAQGSFWRQARAWPLVSAGLGRDLGGGGVRQMVVRVWPRPGAVRECECSCCARAACMRVRMCACGRAVHCSRGFGGWCAVPSVSGACCTAALAHEFCFRTPTARQGRWRVTPSASAECSSAPHAGCVQCVTAGSRMGCRACPCRCWLAASCACAVTCAQQLVSDTGGFACADAARRECQP